MADGGSCNPMWMPLQMLQIANGADHHSRLKPPSGKPSRVKWLDFSLSGRLPTVTFIN